MILADFVLIGKDDEYVLELVGARVHGYLVVEVLGLYVTDGLVDEIETEKLERAVRAAYLADSQRVVHEQTIACSSEELFVAARRRIVAHNAALLLLGDHVVCLVSELFVHRRRRVRTRFDRLVQ